MHPTREDTQYRPKTSCSFLVDTIAYRNPGLSWNSNPMVTVVPNEKQTGSGHYLQISGHAGLPPRISAGESRADALA